MVWRVPLGGVDVDGRLGAGTLRAGDSGKAVNIGGGDH
jgi:hypothetical protein